MKVSLAKVTQASTALESVNLFSRVKTAAVAKLASAVLIGGVVMGGLSFAPAAQAEDFVPVKAAPLYSSPVFLQVAQADDMDDENDPLETINRFMFKVNEVFEVWFIRPASTMWEAFVPPPVRTASVNFIDNLKSPVTLANDLLQGEWERAQTTVYRFGINSTLGIGGLFDEAADRGYEKHSEDFGQTMASWGVGEGFYLVLPLLGPSNPRDAIGQYGVDPFLDPIGMWNKNANRDYYNWAGRVVGGVDAYTGVRDDLDTVRKTSVDFYAAVRSLYRQRRQSEINNGEGVDLPPIPDLSDLDLDYDGGDEEPITDTAATPAGPSAEDQ
ncbi:MAG: MlaA family lipoprotein [Magnetovibrionaceae bacterium]